MEAIPALIGAGGQIFGGIMGSNAAEQAAEAQLEGIRLGVEETRRAREQARADVGPLRRLSAAGVDALAKQFGFPTGGYSEPGFDLAARAAGPSLDPYQDPNRRTYEQLAAPYLEQLRPITNRIGDVANMFSGPMEGGQPAWYRNALASFKQSPGYEFARDEALRQFNQSARGNIMGGGRLMGGARLASGYAAQDYDKFRENIINSILSGSKLGLTGLQQQAEGLTGQLGIESTAMSKEDDRYINYFNRLLKTAGLGETGAVKSAELGEKFGSHLAQLGVMGGAAEAKGITQSTNALTQGITGATTYLTGPQGPFNAANWASSTSGDNYSGGGGAPYSYGGDTSLGDWSARM